MKHFNRWITVLVIIVSLSLSACRPAATGPIQKVAPAHIEEIAGTDLHELTLTQQAADRTDIQTTPVVEAEVMRKRTVRGEVMAVPETEPVTIGTVWVRVPLIEGDLNKIDRSQPALILPLGGDNQAPGLTAQVVTRPPVAAEPAVYYQVSGAGHGLAPGQAVRVELPLSNNGNGTLRMIVPYSAVLYDVHGETWVYTNPAPLTFVRHLINVDYIEGDQAILLEGPPAGTSIVTVGVAELFGLEFGIGH